MSVASHSRAPRFLRGLLSRALPVTATVVAVAAALGAPLAAVAAPPAPAGVSAESAAQAAPGSATQAFGDAPVDALSLEITPVGATSLVAGQTLTVSMLVANRTDQPVEAGQLQILLDTTTIDTRYELSQWESGTGGPGTELARVDAPALIAGEQREVRATIAATSIPLDANSGFGPRGISAAWSANGTALASARSTIVWAEGQQTASVAITPIVPIVAPPESPDSSANSTSLVQPDLIGRDRLAALTGPDGDLTQLLESVRGTGLTLGIDPRLLVSIRILGDQAPASAVAWLDELTTLDNPTFPLGYADASPTLALSAGLSAPLEPSDFSYAIDDANFPAPTPTPTPGQSPGATDGPGAGPAPSPDTAPAPTTQPAPTTESAPDATPEETGTATPTPSPTAAPEPPTLAELLEFPYSRPDLAWPLGGTIGADQLSALSAWHGGAVIVGGDQVAGDPEAFATEDGHRSIDGVETLVTDADLTAAVGDAVSARLDSTYGDGANRAATLLAIIARELPNQQRHLYVALPRTGTLDPERISRLISDVGSTPWSQIVAPDAPAAAESLPTASLIAGGHSGEQIDRFRDLVAATERGTELSSIFADPSRHSERLSVALIAATSAAAFSGDDWTAAASSFERLALSPDTSIIIVIGSDIQVIGQDTALPVFVQNNLDDEATITVGLRPSTGHVTTSDVIEVTIPAHSTQRVQVPVKAIANGHTDVAVTLATPDGTPLAQHGVLDVTVRLQFETAAVVIVVGVAGFLLVAGLIRTIRRRQRTAGEKD